MPVKLSSGGVTVPSADDVNSTSSSTEVLPPSVQVTWIVNSVSVAGGFSTIFATCSSVNVFVTVTCCVWPSTIVTSSSEISTSTAPPSSDSVMVHVLPSGMPVIVCGPGAAAVNVRLYGSFGSLVHSTCTVNG